MAVYRVESQETQQLLSLWILGMKGANDTALVHRVQSWRRGSSLKTHRCSQQPSTMGDNSRREKLQLRSVVFLTLGSACISTQRSRASSCTRWGRQTRLDTVQYSLTPTHPTHPIPQYNRMWTWPQKFQAMITRLHCFTHEAEYCGGRNMAESGPLAETAIFVIYKPSKWQCSVIVTWND